MHFGKTRNKDLLFNLLIFIFICFLCFWSLYPTFKGFVNSLPGGGDVFLLDWILNQNIQKIPFHLTSIFQGNIFYPYKNVMAFSDLFFPASILAYLPLKISGLPAVAYNFNLILGQFLLILISFLWFLDISKQKYVSLVGAVALAMSQIRMNFVGYLQMWISTWWLGSCWMIWRYFKYGKPKYLLFASILAVIQVWESPFPFFYIFFFSLVALVAYYKKNYFKTLRNFYVPIITFFVFTFPLLIKYLQVSKEYAITRSIREAAHFSMSLNDIWGYLFSPGLFSLLFIGLFLLTKRFLKDNKDFFWIACLGIFSFLMSLGPVLKIGGSTFKILEKYFIPLPYGVFYYIIPGFKGLRTPLRWIWLFAFSVSAFFVVVLSKYRSKYKNLILTGCLVMAVAGGSRMSYSIRIPKPEEYPMVYKELKNLPGKVVIEMPMYSWGIGEPFQHEFEREFFSIYHQKFLLNGASGLNPPEWEKLQSFLWKNFPDDKSTQNLKEIGVDYVVLHKDEFTEEKLRKIILWDSCKVIWQDESSMICRLN